MRKIIKACFPKPEPEDMESTVAPWWVLFNPGLVDPWDIKGSLPCAFVGPFFSRESAESYLDPNRYKNPGPGYAYCEDGVCSEVDRQTLVAPVGGMMPRLEEIAKKYERLLLRHLKVMLRDGNLIHSDGLAGQAELMREMAEAGLLEIVAAGPDDILTGRMTEHGESLVEDQEAGRGM